jgi:hypothetical protein
VEQKLRNIARERGEDFALVLTKFGLERVLFRLSESKPRDIFVLKGALLFELWTQERYLHASGDASETRRASQNREADFGDVPAAKPVTPTIQ